MKTIEVKSGKDYRVHSAINNMLATADYNVGEAMVLSNSGRVERDGKLTYVPVYFAMFIGE